VIWHLSIIEVLAAFIGNILCVDTATPQTECQQSVNRLSTEHRHNVNGLSTECQRFWVLDHVKSKYSGMACTDNQGICIRSGQKRTRNVHCPSPKMSVNRASTILWVASCVMQTLCYGIYPYSKFWQHLQAISCESILLHHQMSINEASTERQ